MKKVLFLAANPKGTTPLRLEEEAREIGEELRRSPQDNPFTLEQRWAVRPRDIQQAMLDVNPQIVHFSGHGIGIKFVTENSDLLQQTDRFRSLVMDQSSTVERAVEFSQKPTPQESGLIFEDDQGKAKLVSGEALAGLFELFVGDLECVLLNGCYSASQAQVIAQYVPYVIGMNDVISDRAAIEFAVSFYKAIGAGRSLEFAYLLGKNALQLHGIPEHLTPVLIAQSAQGIPLQNRPAPLSEYPSGPVALDSPLYIDRFPHEARHYESITRPGSLLRIMAPDLMGKTSLMARILNHAAQKQYHRVYINVRDAERNVLTDLSSFLHWFCDRLVSELDLETQIDRAWDDAALGYIANCTDYFEKCVLPRLDQPLVLGIDELDRIFPCSDVATDFFGMLRNWFEKGKSHPTWKNLRLVLAYSTEDYSQFRINQSPFNVGEPLKLRELSLQQVQELARRYALNWTSQQLENLMAMLGGHPYLIRLAMYYVSSQEMQLEPLLEEAPTEDGIYSEHLRRYWGILQNHPTLAEVASRVMNANGPVSVERSHGYQLRSMGLVQYTDQGKRICPSYNLYRIYFSK